MTVKVSFGLVNTRVQGNCILQQRCGCIESCIGGLPFHSNTINYQYTFLRNLPEFKPARESCPPLLHLAPLYLGPPCFFHAPFPPTNLNRTFIVHPQTFVIPFDVAAGNSIRAVVEVSWSGNGGDRSGLNGKTPPLGDAGLQLLEQQQQEFEDDDDGNIGGTNEGEPGGYIFLF